MSRPGGTRRVGWRSPLLLGLAAAPWAGCGPAPTDAESADAPGASATVTEPNTARVATGPAPAPAPAPAPWFAHDPDAGLDFTHVSGEDGRYWIPASVCGGAALADFDGDGDLDAYLVQSGPLPGGASAPDTARPTNRLYGNDGTGRFTDITTASGTGDDGYGMGAATGDVDGDGDVDLYVTNLGPNRLYRNDGDGRFTEIAAAAGVAGPADDFTTGAAFGDLDGDGDLDLVLVNYLAWSPAIESLTCLNGLGSADYCKPTNYRAPAVDRVYRNDGDGTFTDVTDQTGFGAVSGTGLGAIIADFDGDGDADVFVANDAMRDRLWRNDGDWTFTEIGLLAGVATDAEGRTTATMGISAEDHDDDGDLDLLVCNIEGESDSLFRNDGAYFTDITNRAGLGQVSRGFTRFGQVWADFDHDGRLDVFQANGAVMRSQRAYADDPYAEPNLVLRGTERGRYVRHAAASGEAGDPAYTSRGAAFGDVDGDGDVDLLVVNRDGPARVLHNVADQVSAAIVLDVRDDAGAPAIGARVTLAFGTTRRVAEVRTTSSYLTANDPRLVVGIGAAERLESVHVRWPDGRERSFGPFEPGDRVRLDPA